MENHVSTIGSVSFQFKPRVAEVVKKSRWRGIATPFTRSEFGVFEAKGTIDVLWASIIAILLTPIGTRIMLPEFGSRLPEMVFEVNDTLLQEQIRSYVGDAVARWEPRVRVVEVLSFRDQYDDHSLHVSVTYEIVSDGRTVTNSFTLSSSGTLYAGARA